MMSSHVDVANAGSPALRFLTDEDHRLLEEQAHQARFDRGEMILAEGFRRQAIFLLRKGFVRVERAYLGRGIVIARRGPGDVFGEMSFLEGGGASATVVADEDVEVAVIEGADLNALLASVPGFATRFYQSLAVRLSERVAEMTAALPPLIVEDVPQVQLFAPERSGRPGQAHLPTTLIDAVEAFKTAMLETDRGVKDRKLSGDTAQSRVTGACDSLQRTLHDHIQQDRHHEGAIGSYVFRESFPFFMLSRFNDRAFTKPRGYAGDYATIEMLYDDKAAGDGRLGPLIDRWTLELPAARAVKNRRTVLAEAIRQVAADWPGAESVPVTSLAAGPARELFDVLAAPDAPNVLATCVDIDHEALAFASGIAQQLGVANHFTFAQDNVVRLCQGRGHTALAPQALIYSVGLTDYLQDAFVVDLMNWAYDMLLPGGTLIVGNVVPSNPTKAYMDHILEWVLLHRSAEELCGLFDRSRFGTTPVRLQVESAGVDLFAFCRKP
jgi:extracellular factor (EF) 3-hydroxypalmitic acid methyl ester biosynthesis protein